jgi:hypothetical protein
LPVDLDGLASKPLYDEPFVVALPPATHPLQTRKQTQTRRPARRDAAAARGRSLPARSGAGRLQPYRHPREAGLPRHQHRDAAADGGRRCRSYSDAGARRARRIMPSPRGLGVPAVRTPGADCGGSAPCGGAARRVTAAIECGCRRDRRARPARSRRRPQQGPIMTATLLWLRQDLRSCRSSGADMPRSARGFTRDPGISLVPGGRGRVGAGRGVALVAAPVARPPSPPASPRRARRLVIRRGRRLAGWAAFAGCAKQARARCTGAAATSRW